MVEIWMPYGKTEVPISIDVENLKSIIKPKNTKDSKKIEKEEVIDKQTLFKDLSGFIDQSDNVSISIECMSDFKILSFILPHIIEELLGAGVTEDNIRIFLATGINGKSNETNSIKFLKSLQHNIGVLSHDCNSSNLTHVGKTSYGNDVRLNKNFVDSTFKILIAQVRPHYSSGYSGIERVILPGLSGLNTALFNHKMSIEPDSRPGKINENPVYEDTKEAMELVQPDYGINVFSDGYMNLDTVFTGRVGDVLTRSISYADEAYKIKIDECPDIIVVSPGGELYDNNLYLSTDIFYNIQEIVKKGCQILWMCECSNGYGNLAFVNYMKNNKNETFVRNKPNEVFKIGLEKALFIAEISKKAKIYLVSVIPDFYVKDYFGFKTAETANEALRSALRLVGKDFKSIVIPHGSLTIPILE
ncbi:MAG: lactate racemase domain-containing protein [Candidatus Bathyarchaeota archaeon]|nr:lactate racemase domain-containing protein [Candidatus Bathyarchaeota archaeon]